MSQRGGDVGGVVERGPAHDLGVDEMLQLSPHFPDAPVLATPVAHHDLGQVTHQFPHLRSQFALEHQ